MPLVPLHMYPGRTPEQKAGVERGITDAVVRELGVSAQSVEVLLIEVGRENLEPRRIVEPLRVFAQQDPDRVGFLA